MRGTAPEIMMTKTSVGDTLESRDYIEIFKHCGGDYAYTMLRAF
jgi:hypothetical protein